MPETYLIDTQRGVIFSKGTGVFTYADFCEHMARMRADPRFRPDFKQLVDCRTATAIDLTGEQVSELAGRSILSVGTRRAFVVSNDLQFGLTHMFAAYRENRGEKDARVFREMRDALAWLGLPADLDPWAAENPAGTPGAPVSVTGRAANGDARKARPTEADHTA